MRKEFILLLLLLFSSCNQDLKKATEYPTIVNSDSVVAYKGKGESNMLVDLFKDKISPKYKKDFCNKKFNITTDLYIKCVDINGLFKYLEIDLYGIALDYTKIPNDWICQEGLLMLLELYKKNVKCGELGNYLIANNVYDPKETNTKQQALVLMKWFLKDKDIIITDKTDEEIVEMIKQYASRW